MTIDEAPYFVKGPDGWETLQLDNLDDAVFQAERLASLNAGKRFYVLKAHTVSVAEYVARASTTAI